ncbi:hypothetical protein [Ensifer sp. ZNC0028]|uniref:hypothetical protein n=1 Tax=Ensifer sp. ZNC0028 TaxID=1339236 RepID=UPI00068E80AD|nr:hypothetical protein [Ensifer sp. ZNC0028]
MSSDDRDSTSLSLPTSIKCVRLVAVLVSVVWVVGTAVVAYLKPVTSINEWGDFLAGTSAPLAFLWLVLAVLLQSAELRAQRQELELTREEMKESRNVMSAQAAEARKHAGFIEKQTGMLEQDRSDRQIEAVFDAHVALLATRLRQYAKAFTFLSSTSEQFRLISPRDFPDDQRSIADTVSALRTALRNRRGQSNTPMPLTAVYPYDLARVVEAAEACWRASKSLPTPSRVKAEAMELDELNRQVVEIKSAMANYPSDRTWLQQIRDQLDLIGRAVSATGMNEQEMK